MARIRRRLVSQDTGSYHIISRVAGDEYRLGDEEKEFLFNLIKQLAKGFFVTIHAFCIMDNHFHILLTCMEKEAMWATNDDLKRRYKAMYGKNAEPPEGRYSGNGEVIPDPDGGMERLRERLGSVSRFVQELKQNFSRWYNDRNKRTGYFWGGRFKGVIVYKGDGQLIVSSYIDLNPLRAGIVECPEHYRWSSLGWRSRSPVKAGKVLRPITLEDVIEGSESGRVYDLPPLEVSTELDGLAWYREFVYLSGSIEREGKASIPQHLVDHVVACHGYFGIKDRLRYRLKNFSEGIAIGGYNAIAGLQQREKRKHIRPRQLLGMHWAFTTRTFKE